MCWAKRKVVKMAVSHKALEGRVKIWYFILRYQMPLVGIKQRSNVN